MHPEVPDEELPGDLDRVLMPAHVRDGLLDSLRRVDEAIAKAVNPQEGASHEAESLVNDPDLMAKLGDWAEHSRRVQNVLRHVTTDEERIAHLDFETDDEE
jgi:hypothetical protein